MTQPTFHGDLNTGPCVGGPMDGQSISSDDDEIAVLLGPLITTYRWRSLTCSVGSVTVTDLSSVVVVKTVPSGGYWEWEHHQERDDLPADRN